jgi:phenylacetic acid degradation protein
MPAKVIRPLSDEEIAWKSDGTRTYQELTRRCLATLVETIPLTEVEAGRKRIEMPDVIPLTELKKRGG